MTEEAFGWWMQKERKESNAREQWKHRREHAHGAWGTCFPEFNDERYLRELVTWDKNPANCLPLTTQWQSWHLSQTFLKSHLSSKQLCCSYKANHDYFVKEIIMVMKIIASYMNGYLFHLVSLWGGDQRTQTLFLSWFLDWTLKGPLDSF